MMRHGRNATRRANGVCAHVRTHKTTKANRHECVLRGGAGYRLAAYASTYLVYRGDEGLRASHKSSFVRYAVSPEGTRADVVAGARCRAAPMIVGVAP